LTKVFIVILTVFAIAFSMLVIQYTLHANNYRRLAEESQGDAIQANGIARAQKEAQEILKANLGKTVLDQKDQIEKLRADYDKLAGEVETVKNERLLAINQVAALEGNLGNLTRMFAALSAERDQLQDQLTEARKQVAALQQENFQLAGTNQTLDLEKQLSEKTTRRLTEINFQLDETVKTLRARLQASGTGVGVETSALPSGETAAPVAEQPSAVIRGKIIDIRDMYASISIGAAHGVKPGMDMIVFRGSQYLGKLKITKVLPDQSAGELEQIQGNIRAGDDVANKLSS
jgi:hypothetical protein